MPWQFIMVLRIAVDGLYYILVKKVADGAAKTRSQFFIYSFCAIFSLLFFLITKDFIFRPALLPVAGLGILNSMAVFSNLRAINISLSKTSVLRPLNSIVAIALGAIFLNETKLLNNSLLFGILLCFLSPILFLIGGKINNKANKLSKNKQLLMWVVILSLIWGLVTFAARFFALKGVSSSEFILCWYFGSWVGAAFILFFSKKENLPLNKKVISNTFLLAIMLWVSLLFSYNIIKFVPIAVAEPIFMVSEIIIPIIIGLFWFKESKKITLWELSAIIAGIIGGIIITLKY